MFNKESSKKQIEQISNSTTTVGKGSVIEGNIETFGNIRVEGKVLGNLKSKSKVAIGNAAFVEGTILAQNAEIEGEVKGLVQISEVLILKATALIHGDIITNKLIIEAGATFNGQCKMGAIIKEIKIGDEQKEREGPTLSKEKSA